MQDFEYTYLERIRKNEYEDIEKELSNIIFIESCELVEFIDDVVYQFKITPKYDKLHKAFEDDLINHLKDNYDEDSCVTYETRHFLLHKFYDFVDTVCEKFILR